MGARRVFGTHEEDGHIIHGVQDTDTGIVYPFPEEMTASIVADVDTGRDSLASYGKMFAQEQYEITEVES